MVGTVEPYETKRGERRYRIRWDLPPAPDGRRRQRTKRGYRTKREAKAALAEVAHDQANRGRVSVHSRTTLGEYATTWLASRRRLQATSLDNLRTAIEVHIVPRLGARRMQDISGEDVAWLYNQLADHGKRAGECRTAGVTCVEHGCEPNRHGGLAAKSVAHVHAALRAVLAQATEDGLIVINAAESQRARDALPRRRSQQENAEVHHWTAEQARTFIDVTEDDRLGALWTTMLGTGLRRGEALALRWEDVDLEGGTLRVRRSLTAVRGRVVTSDSTKTTAGRRTIVLGDDLVQLLGAHRKRQAEDRSRLGPVWQEPTGGAVVFAEEDGRIINPNRASRAFTRAAEGAGLPRIGLHGLRHTHATILLGDGVPITAVAQRLGHEDPSITLSVYSHAMPADDARVADARGRLLFGSVTP